MLIYIYRTMRNIFEKELGMGAQMTVTSDKSKWVAFFLCFFFGFLGLHNFYVGKWVWGLIYIFTAGLLGIGWLVDIIRILIGSFRDSEGFPLRK